MLAPATADDGWTPNASLMAVKMSTEPLSLLFAVQPPRTAVTAYVQAFVGTPESSHHVSAPLGGAAGRPEPGRGPECLGGARGNQSQQRANDKDGEAAFHHQSLAVPE